jgi:predicted RNA-binding Zn-ribbon protein involved in translation (DUF1610 family)
MKKGKPHFFCEHCSAEVSLDAERCPSCGRRFASIRCPKCGFTGGESHFSNGCPDCGYSAHFDDRPIFSSSESNERFIKNAALPLWVYVVTISAFIAAAGIFFINLTQ